MTMRMRSVRRGSMAVVLAIVGIVRVRSAASGVFVNAELRRRHPGAQHFPGMDMGVAEREAAQRGLELVERQTRVEQRAQRHVARDAREAVEVQHAAHRRPASLKNTLPVSPTGRSSCYCARSDLT